MTGMQFGARKIQFPEPIQGIHVWQTPNTSDRLPILQKCDGHGTRQTANASHQCTQMDH